jgi:hypothetical protein
MQKRQKMSQMTNPLPHIPYGNFLLSIDKIGLRIGSQYFNKEAARAFQRGNITILFHGNAAQINIHAEFEPYIKNIGKRCLDAISHLVCLNVFNKSFKKIFLEQYRYFLPFITFDDSMCVLLIQCFFTLVEFEVAFDFYDFEPFVKPNITEHPGFGTYKGTFYSTDWNQPRRDIQGRKLSKGHQQSFIAIYNRGKRIKVKRRITRFEMRYHGKYKKYLPMVLLIGTTEDAYKLLLPSARKILRKLVNINDIEFTQFWLDCTPNILELFIKYILLGKVIT